MEIDSLAEDVVNSLKSKGLRVAFAESCTGGMVSATITSVAGSSEVIDMSIVTYSNWVKVEYTDVTNEVLMEHSEVSKETAVLMASGIRKRSCADIGIGITGFAGPGGGNHEKPVGTVFIALDMMDIDTICKRFIFSGERQSVRNQATNEALQMIINIVEGIKHNQICF